MTRKEVLIKARALIANPRNWGYGGLEPREGAYCALGAIKVAAGLNAHAEYSPPNRPYNSAVKALARVIDDNGDPEGVVMDFNDGHGDAQHACVVEAFDTAIERLERAR